MAQFWKILLVDDDEDDYILTRHMLSEAKGGKLSLDWAPTIEIGRQRLLADNYHAVLVDYDLGPVTGLDLIREAVANQYKAPLILYTGRGNYEVDEEAMQAGATLYLAKSEATPLLLERIIRYAIELKNSEEALRRARDELEERVAERTLSLQKTNELLENIFSNVHLLIAYLDRDFNFIRVNQRYAAADGRNPEFFAGRNHFDLYPNEENEAIFRQVVVTVNPYTTFGKPFVYAGHPERGITYWDWSLQPVKEPDGGLSGVVLSLVDVTHRVRAEEELKAQSALLEAMFEAAPEATVLADSQGRIVRANQLVQELFGYTPSFLIQKPVEILLPEESRDVHRKHRQAFCSHPARRPMGLGFSRYALHQDGTVFPVEVSLSPLTLKDELFVICSIRKPESTKA